LVYKAYRFRTYYIIIFTSIMSTAMKSVNMVKAATNRTVVKRLNNKKIYLPKKLVSKIDNSWEWPGHVKVVSKRCFVQNCSS
jgi:hypothetical protein